MLDAVNIFLGVVEWCSVILSFEAGQSFKKKRREKEEMSQKGICVAK